MQGTQANSEVEAQQEIRMGIASDIVESNQVSVDHSIDSNRDGWMFNTFLGGVGSVSLTLVREFMSLLGVGSVFVNGMSVVMVALFVLTLYSAVKVMLD